MSLFLVSLSLISLVTLSILSLLGADVLVSLPVLDLTETTMWLDSRSVLFFLIVNSITATAFSYSSFYMYPNTKSNFFCYLTLLFLASMSVCIFFSNFFMLMLGWDGLGLISFFLVMFNQNQSSISSATLTLMMNRVGDSFFIFSLMLMMTSCVTDFYPWSCSGELKEYTYLSSFLFLTFMTKSALFPFSSWLPLAMAAPTPISALVHSSTLVTAGLYLLMRYSYLFYMNLWLMKMILLISIYTTLYAGMNALAELDFKKLIALSTLSHLGFIGMAFATGATALAFFHLLTHALFKSLVFFCMGSVMVHLKHNQEVRLMGHALSFSPMTSQIMLVALMNLFGLPAMSGFLSKDFILETPNSNFWGVFIVALVYLNVFLTYMYTIKLTVLLMANSFHLSNPMAAFHLKNYNLSNLSTILLCALGIVSCLFGSLMSASVLMKSEVLMLSSSHLSILKKTLPFLLLLFIMSWAHSSKFYQVFPYFGGKNLSFVNLLSSMLFLSTFVCSVNWNLLTRSNSLLQTEMANSMKMVSVKSFILGKWTLFSLGNMNSIKFFLLTLGLLFMLLS